MTVSIYVLNDSKQDFYAYKQWIFFLLNEKIHAESLVIHCSYELIKHFINHFLYKYLHSLMPVEEKYSICCQSLKGAECTIS